MTFIFQGDYFDCQIYRDRIFLWDTWGRLSVYDVREEILDNRRRVRNERNEYVFSPARLKKYCISIVNVKGGIYPLDSAFMGDHLYTATESGFYKRFIQEGKRLKDFYKGKARKLIDIPFYQLAVEKDFMAISGKESGLFELYNSKKYRISKYGKPAREIADGIYSVNCHYTNYVWYDNNNILSSDGEGNIFEYCYRLGKKTDYLGLRLRSYYKRHEFISLQNIAYLPSTCADKQIENERKPKGITQEKTIVRYQQKEGKTNDTEYSIMIDGFSEFISIGSKPRRNFKTSYGVVVESRKEVLVVRPTGKVERIAGPITRCRKATAFGGRDFLIIVFGDCVVVDDMK